MIGLLIFGFILLVGISAISRPFRWRRRRAGFGYGRGWFFGGPVRFEERREFGHYEHHHHHHNNWGGGHHHGGFGGGGGHHGH